MSSAGNENRKGISQQSESFNHSIGHANSLEVFSDFNKKHIRSVYIII